tara:strand:- start:422 stop:1102 length:681 start_codon:yes stop_codon:yes gene_type:complete
MIITIITIIISCTILVLAYLYYWCRSPIILEYDSNIPGPKIVIISGTHGNELAPHYAAIDYFNNHKINKGSIKLIIVNKCGILFYDREQGIINPFNDINRHYGMNNNINNIVEKQIDNATLVIDFHESTKYDEEGGLGNTLTYNNNYMDVEDITNQLNVSFKGPTWRAYNNTRNYKYGDLKGTLNWYCTEKNINYILVETSKKDSYLRRQQITNTILEDIYYKYLT